MEDTTPFGRPKEVSHGGKEKGRYPPEYRGWIVELVRSGPSPGSLAREFEPSDQTIWNSVRRAGLDEGHRSDGLTSRARGEKQRLRRENRQLRMECNVNPERAAVWSAEDSDRIPGRGIGS